MVSEVSGTFYDLSDNRWMDSELFQRWFTCHFLKYASSDHSLLLLLDGFQAGSKDSGHNLLSTTLYNACNTVVGKQTIWCTRGTLKGSLPGIQGQESIQVRHMI